MSKHANFVFVGGDISVDFSNTIKIVDGSKTDLLTTPDSLYKWAKHFELDVPYESLEVNFQKFVDLRNIIHNIFQDFAYNKSITTVHLNQFNQFIQNLGIYPQILTGDPVLPKLSFKSKLIDSSLFHHILNSFLNIISNEKILRRLKPCENHECVLLFIDSSRNISRRWCSMDICGNKIKASNFYYRHRLNN